MSDIDPTGAQPAEVNVGMSMRLRADRPAHGGESIGTVNDQVVFLSLIHISEPTRPY